MNLGNAATSAGANVCVLDFFLNEGGDRHAQPHRGSMIKGAMAAMAGAVGEAAAGNPRMPPQKTNFVSQQSSRHGFLGKARQAATTVRRGVGSGADLVCGRGLLHGLSRGRIKSIPLPRPPIVLA
jgi:hypothetical protein